MRVLHIITGLEAGGAEQWLRLLLRYSATDAEVIALTNAGVLADAIAGDGVRVAVLGMRGNRDLGAVPRLVGHIRRGRYDLVHTHLYRAQVYGSLAARLAGVRRVVSTEHSLNDKLIEGRPVDRPGVRGLYLAAARLTTRMIAVSEPVARRLVAWGVPAERISVVGVGIDTPAFAFDADARRSARAELELLDDTMLVGGVGRLVEPKRFDLLLRALAPVPDTTVLLVGDGPARPGLVALAAELGMSERVRFVGQRLDVARWLAAMDVFASTSPEETFGVAILEALAAGLPVVYATAPAVDSLPASALIHVRRAEPTAQAFHQAFRDLLGVLAGRPRAAASPGGFADYDAGTLARRVDRIYEECLAPTSFRFGPYTSGRAGFGRSRHG